MLWSCAVTSSRVFGRLRFDISKHYVRLFEVEQRAISLPMAVIDRPVPARIVSSK